MPQRWMTAGLALLGIASLLGCHDSRIDERLARIEARLSTLEGADTRSSAAEAPAAPAPHGVTADVISLEGRLAALEQRVAATEKAVSTPQAPGGVAEGRMEQRRERRSRLREVTDEYRERLAEIRQSQKDPAARQQAVREALEWYREQRRAVLSGEEPAPLDVP
jgi:chromosome segregation ATPase